MEGEPTADLIRAQLRRARASKGLSQEDFGKRVNYSGSQVSAVELGQRPLDKLFLTRADEVLETGELLVSLLKLAERDGEPSWFMPWLDAERNAKQLRYYNPTVIPGLLQTAAYARRIFRFDDHRLEEEVDRLVQSRLERHEILTSNSPPQVVAVVDEVALRHCDQIMREQLAHLLKMAELPNVHILIIPSSTGLHVGWCGPLALAMGGDGGWVGQLDSQLTGTVVDVQDDVATLLARWESIRNEALPRQQSIKLMKEVESQHGSQ
ncbi:helix-turn-helix domain-containing protein [Micromonospora hortensis]|uniref:helix-turn-helix domain-containing protein n=1 Tax=Micromonospora hortensis TaxID=2911209 RepID=UPI001EE91987|nr:helix-turn-helix transcriptional regulator [Micromonospora hortensis]MCG5453234.1 helix-turn-helix domain-containing protein [Micromonospora hortensis]